MLHARDLTGRAVARSLAAASVFALLQLAAVSARQSLLVPRVEGQVIDASSGQPVAGATVTLVSADQPAQIQTLTDISGRFVFRDTPGGRYTVTASAPGHVFGSLGQRTALDANAWIRLVPSSSRSDLSIRLWKFGHVQGRVENEEGKGLAGALVQAYAQREVFGRLVFRPIARTSSNAAGDYELSNLQPGVYVIAVTRLADSSSNRVPIFYPNTPFIEAAQQFSLAGGELGTTVDFTVTPLVLPKVNGRVMAAPSCHPLLEFRSLSATGVPGATPLTTTATLSNGTFQVDGLPEGTYEVSGTCFPSWKDQELPGYLMATEGRGLDRSGQPLAPVPTGETWWVRERLDVDRSGVANVALQMRRGVRVKGHVVFDGASPQPTISDRTRYTIRLRSAEGLALTDMPIARIEADGTFQTVEVPPGRYMLGIIDVIPGWSVGRITNGAADLTGRAFALESGDSPEVVVTLTDRPSGLSGQVTGRLGLPVPFASVLVFPTDSADWSAYGPLPGRVVEVRTDDLGQYQVSVPPGSYFIRLAPEPLSAVWRLPENLREHARAATKVTVRAHAETTVNLRKGVENH